MIDFIFSEEQYRQLKEAYNRVLFANNRQDLIDVKSLVYTAEQSCFRLPTPLRKVVKNNLNIYKVKKQLVVVFQY